MSVLFLCQTLTFFLCFLLERAYTEVRLGFLSLSPATLKTHALVSGVLSDFWMAGALSAFCLFLCFSPKVLLSLLEGQKKRLDLAQKSGYFFFCFLTLVLCFLISLHIPYVDFFGSLVSPEQLRYLFDLQFARASADMLLDHRIAITFFIPTLFFVFCHWFLRKKEKKWAKGMTLCAIILLCAAPLAQIAKVQMNTQKFTWTPLVLRVNFIENLVIQGFRNSSSLALNEDDARALLLWRQKTWQKKDSLSLSWWADLVQNSPIPAQTAVGRRLTADVAARLKQGKPVAIWIVMIESFRPEDGSFFYPQNSQTLEPFYDSLARQSIAFTNAWTVGGVTRAGQEGSLCGLWTSELTSAMRDLPSLNPSCSFEMIKQKFGDDSRTSFWYGGRLAFDGQGSFWRKHGAQIVVGRENFPANVPSTWWGASDIALFHKVVRDLAALPAKKVEFRAIMTLTNHADWSVPADRPQALADRARTLPYDGQATVLYTDEALSQFVRLLKTTPAAGTSGSLWDSSVVFFVNDHGTLNPSFVHPDGGLWGLSPARDTQSAISRSRANLLVSGGLTQAALGETLPQQTGLVVSRVVSQADIFPTAMELLGFSPDELKTPSDSLFATSRRWPVVVDLGDHVFLPDPSDPNAGKVWSRSAFLQAKPPLTDKESGGKTNGYENTARHFFRVYQELLATGTAGRKQP